MDDFLDIALPDFLYSFIVGGPTFDTEIQHSNNHREVRFANHVSPINKYKISGCILNSEQIKVLQDFFCTVRGKKYAFRIQDRNDYIANEQPLLQLRDSDESKFKFQLAKFYTTQEAQSLTNVYRKVLTIISPSLIVTLDKKELDFKLDNKGVVSIEKSLLPQMYIDELKPKGYIDPLKASFKFNIPVRFDTDALNYRSELGSNVVVEPFELVEVLL